MDALERDGVNGFSRLPTDPAWYLERAAQLPQAAPAPAALPPYAAARRWAAFFYYAQVVLQRWRFPFGPDHRPRNPVWEGITYLAKFRRVAAAATRTAAALAAIGDKPFTRVLADRVLIRGAFLSEEGSAALIDTATRRLLEAGGA